MSTNPVPDRLVEQRVLRTQHAAAEDYGVV
jgi:hypothetical protein